jgi:C4-dicarboxylate transporter DctM subunit
MALAMFLVLFILLFLEVPIIYAIGISALVGIYFSGIGTFNLIAHAAANSLNSFPLLAVPFFILAGSIMSTSTMAQRLINVGKVLMGNKPGSLANITVFACAFFAALSGSGPATTAAIGGIMIPAMIKDGYRPSFATSVACAGGILGPVIPPSISFIIYGVSANESIADLFIAGIIPGILMVIAMLVVIRLNMRRWGGEVTIAAQEHRTAAAKMKAVWEAKWALLMPIIVLGGIYAGVVTPTEAAVVAVLYSLVVSLFIQKDLKFKGFVETFRKSVIVCGSILLIVVTATAFGNIMALYQVPVTVADAVSQVTTSPILVLLLVNIFLLVVGCFMETIAAILILTPILLPIVEAAGMSKLAFGVVMNVSLMIGQLTPPLGVSLFVALTISKLSIRQVAKYLYQFIFFLLVPLFLLTYFPQISEFLPRLLSGK